MGSHDADVARTNGSRIPALALQPRLLPGLLARYQALLEAPTDAERDRTLLALLQMAAMDNDDGSSRPAS